MNFIAELKRLKDETNAFGFDLLLRSRVPPAPNFTGFGF